MKSMRNFYCSVLGLFAGVSSWAIVQSGFNAIDALFEFGFYSSNNVSLSNYFLEGVLVGFGLGMVLQLRASLWYHHNLVLVLSKMFLGSLFGAIIGLFSFAIGYFMQILQIEPWLSRITTWTILGLLFILATELLRLHSGFFWPRVISGGIGGLIGGGIFELLLLYQISGPDHLFGLVLVGFSISFFIGIIEDLETYSALRVISGPQEGQIFLLDQSNFYLGYGFQNDFILNDYAEVGNSHLFIGKKDKEIFIENLFPENEVLVNYRSIDHQQAIKKGDIIKIGTALLQYYEI